MAKNLTQEDVTSRVEEIIKVHVGADAGLSPETQLYDELDIDSLELVELGIQLEKAFNVTLPDAKIRRSKTLNDLIQLVLRVKQGTADA